MVQKLRSVGQKIVYDGAGLAKINGKPDDLMLLGKAGDESSGVSSVSMKKGTH